MLRFDLALIEHAVDDESHAQHDDETANADGLLRSLARKGNHQHQAQAETDERHTRASMALRPAALELFVDGSGALKALRIDLGRWSQALLDHRDSFANLKLTHTGSGHGGGDEEHPESHNHRNWNHEDHEIVQTPSRNPCLNRLDWAPLAIVSRSSRETIPSL